MPKTEAENEDSQLLEKLGGDERVLKLLEIAITAYKFLPSGMMNLTTGKSTRTSIIEAIEAFGIPAARIPWERFPKRFHKNRPELQLFKEPLTAAEIKDYWAEVIAAQEPERPKRSKGKRAS